MTREELAGEMPLDDIVRALDDDGDGQADESAWAAVLASAEERVLECWGGAVPERGRGTTARARRIFALEILYRRRGFSGDRNPFQAQATAMERRLRELAAGELAPQGEGGGEIFGAEAKVAAAKGLMA